MKRIFGAVFVLYVFFLFLCFVFAPKISFSEEEKRALQILPKVKSGEDIKSFPSAFDKFVTDQFPKRKDWVRLKNISDLISLKKEINGVYVNNGKMISAFKSADKSLTERQILSVNSFAKNCGMNVYFALIPTSAAFSDDLPLLCKNIDQEAYIGYFYENVDAECIDIFSVLRRRKNEYIYYATDHHWTSLGAFYAYRKLAEGMGQTVPKNEDVYFSEVSSDFKGTMHSKVLIDLDIDKIFRYDYKKEYSVTVCRDGLLRDGTGFYEQLKTGDKYSYFLGGNNDVIHVKSSCGTGRSLLLVRDSFASCLVQFFIKDYSEIILIDLRYASLSDIESVVADDVLIIYSTETLSSDESVLKLSYYGD